MGGTEHGSLVVGQRLGTDDEAGSDRGGESDEGTDEDNFKSHCGDMEVGGAAGGRPFILPSRFICLEEFPFMVMSVLPYKELIKTKGHISVSS